MFESLNKVTRNCARLEICGPRPERFFNACASGKIRFWDLEYVSPCVMRCSMPSDDVLRLRPVARRCACRAKVLRREGPHYASRKILRRAALLCGLAAACALLWCMTSVIWTMDVTGCEKVAPAAVLRAMEEEGVTVGTLNSEVDASELRNRILLRLPDLVWFTVNTSGSRATVDVRERLPTPEILDTSQPADIVADFDGLITSMRVYKGEAQVTEGTMVHSGDLLVSGAIELPVAQETIYTHALADLMARIWYNETAVAPVQAEKKTYTGQASARCALIIGNFRINLYKNSGKPYDNCDKIIETYDITLPGGIVLPFSFSREVYREYESLPYTYTADDMYHALEDSAAATARSRGENLVTLTGTHRGEANGAAFVRVSAETVRNIGRTVYMYME